MEKTFMEAMDFRHACKVFDETKKITDEDMNYILEVGRKSPSSFGMEGWKFLVITNEELKAKIRPVCWNQVQVTSCSHLVIILAAIDAVKKLAADVGIPADLKDIVKSEDIPFLAQSAYDDACRPGNPRETSVEEITKLYESLI